MHLGRPVKLISFSLFGTSLKYLYGMEENMKLAKEFYPGWDVIVYHDNSIPIKTCKNLENLGAIMRNVTSSGLLAPMWRFLVADETCERFIVRDSDSRIAGREAMAVEQWQSENTAFHVMRDHPHHKYKVMGGMWGGTSDLKKICFGENRTMRQALDVYTGRRYGNWQATSRSTWWMVDQDFLSAAIYDTVSMEKNATVHAAATAGKIEEFSKPFPSEIGKDKRFVGEVFNVNEQLESSRDWQYKLI